jgi:peptide chain release factor 2
LRLRLQRLGSIFDIDKKREAIKKLKLKTSKQDFWSDPEEAKNIMQKISDLEEDVVLWDKIHKDFEDAVLINELAVSEDDKDLGSEALKLLESLKKEIEKLELKSWFCERFDSHDAIVNIHPGAGGTESQDWAEMLLRMYLRWAESRGFKTVIDEIFPGEEAGIKNVTFTVEGKYAYGYLRAEKGIHRLVRISPFDFSKRRHTSFASVDVIPVIDEEIEIDIDPNDLKIETFRATGAGGQHVNVTDSAVRITHVPTGVVAQCQNDRSQFINRQIAMKILRARLYEKERQKKQQELEKIRGEKKDIAWGSQIRSYIMHPYSMAKDHRTDLEKGDVQRVLDGDLDQFIVEYHRLRCGR